MWIWIFSASFFVILIVLVLLNARINGGFKIETSWLAVALSPAAIALLATGQLSEFSGFGLAFKLREASAKPFSLSVEGSQIKPVPLAADEKRGVDEIPRLIEQRVEALTLWLGRRGYYSDAAIRRYLEELTRYDFFKYVILSGSEKEFRGLVPPTTLLRQMREGLDLVALIEQGSLSGLKDLVTASVSVSANKRDALRVMDEHNLVELPVVDASKRFVGMIERDKLTSSIVLELIATS